MPERVVQSFWKAWVRFMRHEADEDCARIIRDQAHVAVRCAATLRKTKCADRMAVVEFEREGDSLQLQMKTLLNNAFSLRHNEGELKRLTDYLDDVVDCMRKAVEHVEIYKPLLATGSEVPELPEPAIQLLDIIMQMVGIVETMAALMVHSPMPRDEISRADAELERLESEADAIRFEAAKQLVLEHHHATIPLKFRAFDDLYKLLERVTDAANHCGSAIQAIALQEA